MRPAWWPESHPESFPGRGGGCGKGTCTYFCLEEEEMENKQEQEKEEKEKQGKEE